MEKQETAAESEFSQHVSPEEEERPGEVRNHLYHKELRFDVKA